MCYNYHEVLYMEMKKNVPQEPTEEEFQIQEPYVPRPKWQVAAAWVGLAVFLGILVMYYGLMFK